MATKYQTHLSDGSIILETENQAFKRQVKERALRFCRFGDWSFVVNAKHQLELTPCFQNRPPLQPSLDRPYQTARGGWSFDRYDQTKAALKALESDSSHPLYQTLKGIVEEEHLMWIERLQELK